MEFNTPYTRHVCAAEENTLPSVTEPDTTMTIPEIIARYTRGMVPDVEVRTPEFERVAPETDFDPLDYQPDDFRPVSGPSATPQAEQSQEPAPAPAAGAPSAPQD